MNDLDCIAELERDLIEKIACALIERRKRHSRVKALCSDLGIPRNEYALFLKRTPRKWALPRLIRLAFRLDIRVRLCYDEVQSDSSVQLVLPFDN